MGFYDFLIPLKVAVVILPIVLILDIVNVAAPYWSGMTIEQTCSSPGHWKICVSQGNDKIVCNVYSDALADDWLVTCRVLAIIGILAMVAATVLEVLYIFVFSKDNDKTFFIFIFIATIVGAASMFLALIIWAVKHYVFDYPSGGMNITYALSWAFGLSITGTIFSTIGAVSVAVVLLQN